MANFNTIVETDAIRDEPEFHLEMAIAKICRYMERQIQADCEPIRAVAMDLARMQYEERGPDLFGKPTPWLRKFLGRKPNYTRIDVGIVNARVYVTISPIAV